MTPTLTRRAAAVVASAGLLASALLAGCSSIDPTAGGTAGTSSSASAPASAASSAASASPSTVAVPTLTMTSQHALNAVLPTDTLTFAATNGTVSAVTVATGSGTAVPGSLSGTTWKPTRNLLPQTDYVATVTLTASDNSTRTETRKFSTLKTTIENYDILYTGFTLGVGMPAIIQFVQPVETQAMRAEVVKNVSVTSSPRQEGSWGWVDNRQLMWRPKDYWTKGTKVTVTANLAGIQTGKNSWVGRDATGSFSIGDARISYVNIATHQMRVTENGKTIKTIPITAGREPDYTTRSGIKVIMQRYSHIVMDSTTVDIPKNSPDAYHLDVKWAMRLTWSGEFLHAAPWSVASQGVANVSHGCTGMSDANAKWMFDFSRAGDVVVFTGSNRPMTLGNGIGVWNDSFSQWQALASV
ncbi:MAG TPA: Ig-like domain-containing protein [Propionibacteriaceae bacterium]|nr:Ig-like domain-containing protein [Propionibacteriaceae bacterium]